MNKKTKFTAIDIENNLFDLATGVMKKNVDASKVNAAVGAYRAILALQALKIKAAKGTVGRTWNPRASLKITETTKVKNASDSV